jgi:hypothetical protein
MSNFMFLLDISFHPFYNFQFKAVDTLKVTMWVVRFDIGM